MLSTCNIWTFPGLSAADAKTRQAEFIPGGGVVTQSLN